MRIYGKIYQHVTGAKSYNRLLNGPTWGISGASKALAKLVQQDRVSYAEIKNVLLQYPTLFNRLKARGVDILSIEKGLDGKTLAALLRTLIYKARDAKELGFESRDISNLSYEEVMLIAPQDQRAIVESEGISREKLVKLMDSSDSKVALRAFERLKDGYSTEILKGLIYHDNLSVRRAAFDEVSGKLRPSELDNLTRTIINIPALIAHPNASHNTKLSSVRATVLVELCPELLRAFAKQMKAVDIWELFNMLYFKIRAYPAKENLNTLVETALGDWTTPVDVLFEIAKGKIGTAYAEKAMGRMVEEGKLAEINLGELRDSRSRKVKILAFFHDKGSTPAELAQALSDHIQKNNKVSDGYQTDYDHYIADHGRCIPEPIEVEVFHYEYSSEDIALARSYLALRSESARGEILIEMRKINTELAEKL